MRRWRATSSFRRHLRLESLESRRLLAAVVLSDHEQLAIELINHFRANTYPGEDLLLYDLNDGLPAGTISETPQPPLAPNAQLTEAARLHSLDMFENFYFEHDNLDGEGPGDRIGKTGYPFTGWGENLAYTFTNYDKGIGIPDLQDDTLDQHWGLFFSSGHRQTMYAPHLYEIGIGFGQSDLDPEFPSGRLHRYQTQVYATRTGNPFLTGVAFQDRDANDFYSIGEGFGEVTVSATDGQNTFTTTTGPSGGYSLQVPPGSYAVTASGGQLPEAIVFPEVVVSGVNVKLDFGVDPTQVLPDDFEPNDLDATATQLGIGDHRLNNLTLDQASDRDRFHWTARASGWLQVDVTGGSSLEGMTLTVRRADNQQVVLNRLASDDLATVSVFAGVDYYVEVAGGQSVTNTGYTLYVDGVFPPLASNDGAATEMATAVNIPVLDNDHGVVSELVPQHLVIQSSPGHGTAVPQSDGSVRYIPNAQFMGVDSFTYSIRDESFFESGRATVWVHVGVRPGQNPALAADVNLDGDVTARDALAIINKLTRELSPDEGFLPVDFTQINGPFFNVNGDERISSLDALQVINEMARRSNAAGEFIGIGLPALRDGWETTKEVNPSKEDSRSTRQQSMPKRSLLMEASQQSSSWKEVAMGSISLREVGSTSSEAVDLLLSDFQGDDHWLADVCES